MKNENNFISIKILIVEEEITLRNDLFSKLKELRHEVSPVASIQEAKDLMQKQSFDLVLTTTQFGSQSGWSFIQEINRTHEDTTSVAMTTLSVAESTILILQGGALECLPKPVAPSQLFQLVKKVQNRVALKRENECFHSEAVHKDYFNGFTSPFVGRLEEFIDSVSSTDRPILLRGESGSGKSTLARLIHERSKKKGKSFVTVCCTVTEFAIEAELLGSEDQSHSRGGRSEIGKLEPGFDGTLFLDEVGDLSPPAQVKLLRFLQDGKIEDGDSGSKIKVYVRLIVSTRKNLEEAVRDGKFREDLYFRLNALECEVVPLRHRKEDLPVLIQRLLRESSINQGLAVPPAIPETVLKELLSYSWPGNIRELRNVIGRLIVLSANRPASREDLPMSIRSQSQRTDKEPVKFATLEEIEKQHIMEVLSVESNQEKAAEILGITTVTLWKKRKTFGLP